MGRNRIDRLAREMRLLARRVSAARGRRDDQPRATNGAELRVSADRDGRNRPADSTTSAAGHSPVVSHTALPSVLASRRADVRRSPDG